MPDFQGSGFSIALPDECFDGSSYNFVLPERKGYSATLSIRFQRRTDDFALDAFVQEQLTSLSTSLEDFKLQNQAQGRRGECDGAMLQFEWGGGKSRFRQKMVVLATGLKPARVYILTSLDLVGNSEHSDAVFEQMMRSFLPNDTQLW